MTAPSSLVEVTLDEAQRRAVALPAARSLLVLGEAGHGKTTVALHRLAHLARHRDKSLRFRAVVIVPTEGLRSIVERALVRLGLDVPALTYDRFARRQARRAFADVPRRESQDATAATMRLKRDPSIGEAIEAIASAPPHAIDDDPDAPEVVTRAHAVRGDLQHLFGDREVLARVVQASGGRLPRHAISETLDHTRVQFGLTSEEAFAHVEDRKRLVTVDRRSMDDGTPDADAGSIDAEDYAVLFAIDRARALRERARATRPRAYDCIVLDEAQSFAPIELAMLGRSLARGGTLVVAGDSDQQLDADGAFSEWPAAMRALRRSDYDAVVLDVGYRCSAQVVALGRRALGRGTPGDVTPIARLDSAQARAEWLVRTLEELVANEPTATIAVVTRSPLVARRIAADIRRRWPVRLVWGGEFTFIPGVDVTTVDQVRGLEFDHVIVADASASEYGLDPESRRSMYVAITRARQSAHLAAIGPPTAIFT